MIGNDVKAYCDSFDIEILHNIGAVQGDWARLEVEGYLTPFQTRAWLVPLYTILVPYLNAAPLFVVVRDKASKLPVLLFPLCMRRRYGVTVIEFADLGVSDYNAPVIAKNFKFSAGQWRALWQKIVSALGEGAIIWFEKMPHLISSQPNPLAQYTDKAGLMDLASWGVALPATAVEYTKTILDQTFARELAKKDRRVANRGTVDYASARTTADKRAAFQALAEQRQARCDEMGRDNILANPVYAKFYQSVVVDGSANLENLAVLKVGGEIVATVLALEWQQIIYVIMSTFIGGEWKSCSLGNVVIKSAIEQAIDKKIAYFDLTIGNEGYKQYFGASPNALYALMQPLTVKGYVLAFLIAQYRLVKNLMRRFRS